jgi:pilus assembly protein Flp/PilA
MTNIFKDESGATALEYGLLAAMIGAAIMTAAMMLGSAVDQTFSSIAATIASI